MSTRRWGTWEWMRAGRVGVATGALLAIGCGSDPGKPDPQDPGEHVGPPPVPVTLAPGQMGTVVGSGDRATDLQDANADGEVDEAIPVLWAHLDTPMDVALSPTGQLYVIDWNGHKIRAVDGAGRLAFVTGTGKEGDACEAALEGGKCPALAAELNHPTDITFDAEGRLLIAAWHNSKIKRVDLGAGLLENVCGTGGRKFEGDGGPCKSATGADLVTFDLPSSVAVDSAGGILLSDQANQVVRRIAPDGTVKTVAGACPGTTGFGCAAGRGYAGDGGPATTATLANNLGQGTDPQGKIALDADGNLFIADSGNHVVRRVDAGSDGILGEGDATEEIITTVVGTGIPGSEGDGGPAIAAQLRSPTDVAVAADGTLYIADRGNSCVRRVGPDGVITTAAGQCGSPGVSEEGQVATEAALDTPYGVELDGKGGLFVADSRNHCIRKVLLP